MNEEKKKKKKIKAFWKESINVLVFNPKTLKKHIQIFSKRNLVDKVFIFTDKITETPIKGKVIGINEDTGDLVFVTDNPECEPDTSKDFMLVSGA